MKNYEYKSFESFEGADAMMNELASQGWRCIGFYSQHNNYTRYVFEREKAPKKKMMKIGVDIL
jgi:hypothetical protein